MLSDLGTLCNCSRREFTNLRRPALAKRAGRSPDVGSRLLTSTQSTCPLPPALLRARTARRRPGSMVSKYEIIPCRSEEHTSELQSLRHLVCRLLLEKK